MYKAAFRSQNRRAQVVGYHPTKAAVSVDGDARCEIVNVTSMTLMEATAERSALMLELAGVENEIQAAKNAGRFRSGDPLGNRHQSIIKRVAAINGYLRSLRDERMVNDPSEHLAQAVREIAEPELQRAIFRRAREIFRASSGAN